MSTSSSRVQTYMYQRTCLLPSMVMNLSLLRVKEFIIYSPISWVTAPGSGTSHGGRMLSLLMLVQLNSVGICTFSRDNVLVLRACVVVVDGLKIHTRFYQYFYDQQFCRIRLRLDGRTDASMVDWKRFIRLNVIHIHNVLGGRNKKNSTYQSSKILIRNSKW